VSKDPRTALCALSFRIFVCTRGCQLFFLVALKSLYKEATCTPPPKSPGVPGLAPHRSLLPCAGPANSLRQLGLVSPLPSQQTLLEGMVLLLTFPLFLPVPSAPRPPLGPVGHHTFPPLSLPRWSHSILRRPYRRVQGESR